MKRLLPIFFLLFSFSNWAQEAENIVPNPSFELFSAPPIGWYYKGEHFNRVMKYWNSPTASSPDAYGNKVVVPAFWAEKEFGRQKPHSGTGMVGITVYGCENGKPHCREYVQIQLAEPLVVGQTYQIEYWLSHLPRSLQINNIGAYFSKTKIATTDTNPLTHKPQFNMEQIVFATNSNWYKANGQFVAETEAEYLILGNFFTDEATKARGLGQKDLFNFAYYYIDDVFVKKIPPFIDVPVKDDDLTKVTLEKGKTIQLKNLYFDTDKFELLPRSYVELRKLLKVMREHPNLKIEIIGHTDSVGNDVYNIELSKNRAKSVADFLIYNGIPAERSRYKGMGEGKPIASNMNEEGRQANRRVEFVILEN